MTNRRPGREASGRATKAGRRPPGDAATPPRLSGPKLWLFRLTALVGAPVLCFGLIEVALRLVGYGYPTAFLLPTLHNGRPAFVQNNRFGWRFFGPQMARLPWPLLISRPQAPGTVRIFVLGESAAKGDPRPEFGLSRMLERMLRARHPDARFEVVNTAMTAINSHAILPIARSCAAAGGDIWVVYMGNNEVVGPFGAGTVFGPQAPPLALVRSAVALKATRAGQMLDAARQALQKAPTEGGEWGGMQMFLEQQVRADDPRMNPVYHHFRRNLEDILLLARRHGVGVVVSTVAVNLKDCAPFASAHRPGLSAPDRAKWDQLYPLGVQAQEAGRTQEAADRFAEAARLDDTFAELRYRQGQCALAQRQIPEAQRHFQAARDLDTLRFRCDGRLNELIRQAVAAGANPHLLLADAERTFREQSADGLPGEDQFYEHAHLTFEGNYLLARTIAEEVEKLLPERLAAGGQTPSRWPTAAECARQLAWSDWERVAAIKGILPRLSHPPFTGQFNHETQMQRVRAALAKLAPATRPGGINQARAICEAALAKAPEDAALYGQLALLKKAAGDVEGAETAARRRMDLLPGDAEGWAQLGMILVRQQKFEDAAAAFQRAFQLDTQDIASMESRAQCLAALGRREEAVGEFRRVLALKPRLGLAWLHLGQVLSQLGRGGEAEECYRHALMSGERSLSGLLELAGYCQNRGWFEAAATNYIEGIRRDPANAKLYVGAGQNLAALKRLGEAVRYSAEAVRLEPGFAEAHLLHGTILGQQGHLPEAADEFSRALELMPDLLDARVNLGIARMTQGRSAEARSQFEEVLRRSPTNQLALRYLQELRKTAGPASPP